MQKSSESEKSSERRRVRAEEFRATEESRHAEEFRDTEEYRDAEESKQAWSRSTDEENSRRKREMVESRSKSQSNQPKDVNRSALAVIKDDPPLHDQYTDVPDPTRASTLV